MAERVTFPSVSGETLAGLLDLPVGECRGWGVFSHEVADTAQAAPFLEESGRPVEIPVGHSFGGAAVIATVSAPYDSSHLAPGQARRAAPIISAWADQHLVE